MFFFSVYTLGTHTLSLSRLLSLLPPSLCLSVSVSVPRLSVCLSVSLSLSHTHTHTPLPIYTDGQPFIPCSCTVGPPRETHSFPVALQCLQRVSL